jgi:hypothetical protein
MKSYCITIKFLQVIKKFQCAKPIRRQLTKCAERMQHKNHIMALCIFEGRITPTIDPLFCERYLSFAYALAA